MMSTGWHLVDAVNWLTDVKLKARLTKQRWANLAKAHSYISIKIGDCIIANLPLLEIVEY